MKGKGFLPSIKNKRKGKGREHDQQKVTKPLSKVTKREGACGNRFNRDKKAELGDKSKVNPHR